MINMMNKTIIILQILYKFHDKILLDPGEEVLILYFHNLYDANNSSTSVIY